MAGKIATAKPAVGTDPRREHGRAGSGLRPGVKAQVSSMELVVY